MSDTPDKYPLRLPGYKPTPHDCSTEALNWSSLEIQLFHANCAHAVHQSDLIAELSRKLRPSHDSNYAAVWASLRKWAAYDATASIIACSSYSRRADFIRCGFTFGPFRFSCRSVVCPRCAFTMHSKLLVDEFAGEVCSVKTDAFYIVISLKRDADERNRIIFRDADQSDLTRIKRRPTPDGIAPHDYGIPFATSIDVALCRRLWGIMLDALREFCARRGLVFGALAGPELALQFSPLRVLPHLNVVLWAGGLTIDDIRELRSLVRKRMLSLKLKLFPSVACYGLPSRHDLRSVLTYMFKPIGLADAYIAAAERANYEPAALATLNEEVNTFLRLLPDLFFNLRRVHRFGGCHAGSPKYFGVVTPRRQAHREREAARRQNAPKSRPSKHDAPRKPQRSNSNRFEHWFAAVAPKPPPPIPSAMPNHNHTQS